MENLHKGDTYICHDCGVSEGEIHQPGCDMEVCPACFGQLLSCGCGKKKLKGLKRIPHIQWPVLCAYCGELWPNFFMVPNEEWKKYIPPNKRHKVLCRKCYEHIKKIQMET